MALVTRGQGFGTKVHYVPSIMAFLVKLLYFEVSFNHCSVSRGIRIEFKQKVLDLYRSYYNLQ